jgi:PadR family transcriptional regulator, regulatory protein PadR
MGKGSIRDADACRSSMPMSESRSETIWRRTLARVCGKCLRLFGTYSQNDTLHFDTSTCICRSHRHVDCIQVRTFERYAGPTHSSGRRARTDSRMCDAQHIQMISKEALQIQQGSLYPALHHLENRNFLVAEWGPTETGREAKFDRLTAKGRTQLKTETESWECQTEVVAMILQHPLGEPT